MRTDEGYDALLDDNNALRKENERLKNELADYENPKHNLASIGGGAVAQMANLKADNAQLRGLLEKCMEVVDDDLENRPARHSLGKLHAELKKALK